MFGVIKGITFYDIIDNQRACQKKCIERFPEHFMFQLNEDEFEILKSQIATSKKKQGVANCDTIK